MKTNQRSGSPAAVNQERTSKGLVGVRKAIGGGLMALMVFGSIGFAGAAGHAEARVNGPRFDSLSIACGQLQDRRDDIWAEFTGASKARQDQLMDELRTIMQNWVDICQGTFGAIGVRMAPATGIEVAGVNQVSDGPTTSPGKTLVPGSKLQETSRLAH